MRGDGVIGVFTPARCRGGGAPGEAICTASARWPRSTRCSSSPTARVRLVVQGLRRIRIVEVMQPRPYLRARVEELADDAAPRSGDLEAEALVRNAERRCSARSWSCRRFLPDELAGAVQNVTEPGRARRRDRRRRCPRSPPQVKQELLETDDVKARLARLVPALTKEVEVLELGSKIQSQVESEMGKGQREYYLREQLKAIQKELGDSDEPQPGGGRAARRRSRPRGMTEEAKTGGAARARPARQDAARGRRVHGGAHLSRVAGGAAVGQGDHGQRSNLAAARTILDEDHSGLDKVKDRILEYLAVKSMRPAGKDPILCFVGPPGVGKTSLGRSIARALGRKFHRISLGGMRDEAEIRGHRRTYIGALPGQIIQGLRRAETKNPVFMLDEIDKLGMDFRGDPASALLEVLDPEQNGAFRDHYVDVAVRPVEGRCSSRPPTCSTRCRRRCVTGWRSSSSPGIRRRRRSHIARQHLDAQAGGGSRAGRGRAHALDRRRSSACSSGGTRARPGSGTSSARSRRSRGRSPSGGWRGRPSAVEVTDGAGGRAARRPALRAARRSRSGRACPESRWGSRGRRPAATSSSSRPRG